jgi:hypothetical protein
MHGVDDHEEGEQRRNSVLARMQNQNQQRSRLIGRNLLLVGAGHARSFAAARWLAVTVHQSHNADQSSR